MTSDPVARYQTLRGAKSAVSLRLRPMTPGEMIDSALRLYQRLGLTFLRQSLVPTLLCIASLAFVSAYVWPRLIESRTNDFNQYVGELIAGVALAVFVGGPLFLTGVSYTTALVVSLVSDDLTGKLPSEAAAQAVALRSLPRLLIASIWELIISLWGILLSVAILVGGMLLARYTPDSDVWAGVIAVVGILGIFLGVLIFVAVAIRDIAVAPAVALEGLGFRAAGKRSRMLTGRNPIHGPGTRAAWNGFFLIIFITLVLDGSLAMFVELTGIPGFLGHAMEGSTIRPLLLQIIDLLPDFLTLWLVLPLWATLATVIYIERRVRLEGFDVEVLSRNLARSDQSDRYEL